jgi:hypothetical protein
LGKVGQILADKVPLAEEKVRSVNGNEAIAPPPGVLVLVVQTPSVL